MSIRQSRRALEVENFGVCRNSSEILCGNRTVRTSRGFSASCNRSLCHVGHLAARVLREVSKLVLAHLLGIDFSILFFMVLGPASPRNWCFRVLFWSFPLDQILCKWLQQEFHCLLRFCCIWPEYGMPSLHCLLQLSLHWWYIVVEAGADWSTSL